jgi:hypothetical protein
LILLFESAGDCASPEKSELGDSFIKLTLLAEVGRPSNNRWPFDNIGKSTKSEIQVLTVRERR